MPHSSGGGSHGGGFHGGHGGSSRRTSRTYFTGAHRYIYYNRVTRTPETTYANYDVRQSSPHLIILSIIYIPMIIVACLGGCISAFHYPSKIKMNYDTKIVIQDDADLMTDEEEEELMESLEAFQKETGITPAVFTTHHEDWKKKNKTLEKYAYNLYVSEFKDEKHWLIVYSEPEHPDEDYVDWRWEGMQGDRTDSILTEKVTKTFNKRLQNNLLKPDKYTVAEAIGDAFDRFTPHVMDSYIQWGMLIVVPAFCIGVTGVIIFVVINDSKQRKKYSNAILCDEEVINQVNCQYCGGVYIAGHHTNCPYCQAQVPFEYAKAVN
ncbi:hypothetical protein SAMN02910456_00386 [Ruminococcaceae bacterium YRB3002]|nr:hypothetical protein SAMN02910456_00386 [Ruminococcaceae bacterium YRB3002]